MRTSAVVPLAFLLVTAPLGGCAGPGGASSLPARSESPTVAGTITPASPAADSLEQARARAVAAVERRLGDRAGDPAGEVFENLEILGAVPAARLLRIMSVGFARSLGVGCDHCHVPGEWSSDEKREKRVAREMWRMMGRLNREVLPAIPELGEQPTVNCTTCHRGQTVPATSLP